MCYRIFEGIKRGWYWHVTSRRIYVTSLAVDAWDKQGRLTHLLNRLDQHPIQLDISTFARLVQECGNSGALSEGRRLHSHIIGSGFQQDTFLRECLVHMYLKCGSLQHAHELFDKLHSKDVVAWTAMISAYSRLDGNDCFRVFHQMLLEGVMPDKVTVTMMLKACVSRRALAEARSIHSHIAEKGFDCDEVVGTSIISMYGKCNSLRDARLWFDSIHQHDVIAWNAMVAAYTRNSCNEDALQLFRLMLQEGMMPNSTTFVTVLNACTSPSMLKVGRLINGCVLEYGLESDTIVGTALVNTYGKCQSIGDVQRIFHRIEAPDIVSWNATLAAYVHHDHKSQALGLFKQMLSEGVIPDEFTYVTVLNACGDPTALPEGQLIHTCIAESGLESVTPVGNALIHMYGKCGSLENACKVFEEKLVDLSVVTWSVMVAACAEHGQGKEALQLFRQMQLDGVRPDSIIIVNVLNACDKPEALADGKAVHDKVVEAGFECDMIVATALVNMYVKCGSLADARKMFDRMQHRNAVTWNTMLSAYAQSGHTKEALLLFHQMKPGVPDQGTFVAALDACADLAAIAEGKRIHQQLIERKLECDVILGTAIVNMYGKCGSVDEARSFFDKMARTDAVSWNAMIGAYAQHGHVKEALNLFGLGGQEGVKPDVVTFVNVLFACSHAGRLEQGLSLFISMVRDYGMKPTAEHYTCMLDLLGRVGKLDEADELIQRMPTRPSNVEWITLLGACRTHNDRKRGEYAADSLLKLQPGSSTAYVMLSNIQAKLKPSNPKSHSTPPRCHVTLPGGFSLASNLRLLSNAAAAPAPRSLTDKGESDVCSKRKASDLKEVERIKQLIDKLEAPKPQVCRRTRKSSRQQVVVLDKTLDGNSDGLKAKMRDEFVMIRSRLRKMEKDLHQLGSISEDATPNVLGKGFRLF